MASKYDPRMEAAHRSLWPHYHAARDHARAEGREITESEAQAALLLDDREEYQRWLESGIGEPLVIPMGPREVQR